MLKDILLVAGSVVLFGSPVTFIQVRPFSLFLSASFPPRPADQDVERRRCEQMFGYSVALGGLVVFKTPPVRSAFLFFVLRRERS